MILDGRELEFYKYNGDHRPLLEDVRDKLNEVASNWSREQKDHCLGETEQSFKVIFFTLSRIKGHLTTAI